MLSAFEWTTAGAAPAGAVRRHVTGGVTVTAEPEGETYTVLTATGTQLVLDVRGIWLALDVATTAANGLAGASGGEGVPLGRVWLDMVSAVSLSYRPDASVPGVSVPVVPDLSDKATLFAVVSGTVAPGTERLRLRSRYRYAPGDPLLAALAAASPYRTLTL